LSSLAAWEEQGHNGSREQTQSQNLNATGASLSAEVLVSGARIYNVAFVGVTEKRRHGESSPSSTEERRLARVQRHAARRSNCGLSAEATVEDCRAKEAEEAEKRRLAQVRLEQERRAIYWQTPDRVINTGVRLEQERRAINAANVNQAARILKAQALRLSSPTTMTVKRGVKRKRFYFEEELYRNERGTYWIGIYSPSARKERLGRFMQKRKKRNWQERAVLDVPKRPATCLRFKGRFITKHGEELLRAAMEIC
jgi:hypothetical protein